MSAVTINQIAPFLVQATQTMVIQAYNGGLGASQPGGVQVTLTGPSAETHTISTFSFWSDTEVRFAMPSFTNTGSWSAAFTSVLTSNSVTFDTFTSSALITSVTSPTTPGGAITINGSGFGASQGGQTLKSGTGVPFPDVTSWSATQIQAVLPVFVVSGFPPGILQLVQIFSAGHFPLLPPSLESNYIFYIEGNPVLTATFPNNNPLTVAPGQNFEIIGVGLGFSQGATVCKLNGSTITPSFWGTATSGTYNGQQIIEFQVPGGAAIGPASLVLTNGIYSATQNLNIQTALALPGGTTAVRGQPVILTGSGFGGSFGTLTYFSVSGAPIAATATNWSNTQIYTNIPTNADFGPGFFWVFPSGSTRENGIFGGFTVGNTAGGPATSPFPVGVNVVSTRTDGTYPIGPFSPFPQGVVQSIGINNNYSVAWLNPDGTDYTAIATPSTDMTAVGGLIAESQAALGLYPPVVIEGS